MSVRRSVVAPVALVWLVLCCGAALAACGGSDAVTGTVTAKPGATLIVDVTDNHFSVARVNVTVGERVTFEFRNRGAVGHEAWIGTAAQQLRHQRAMGATIMDGDPDGIVIPRGATVELTHTFATHGTFVVACHNGNHFFQGMKFTVSVA